jgi:hypothetical protein
MDTRQMCVCNKPRAIVGKIRGCRPTSFRQMGSAACFRWVIPRNSDRKGMALPVSTLSWVCRVTSTCLLPCGHGLCGLKLPLRFALHILYYRHSSCSCLIFWCRLECNVGICISPGTRLCLPQARYPWEEQAIEGAWTCEIPILCHCLESTSSTFSSST